MIYDGNKMNRKNFIAPTKCQYNKTTTVPKNRYYNNSDGEMRKKIDEEEAVRAVYK